MAHYRNVNIAPQENVADKKLIKKYEMSIDNLNTKLSKLKSEV